MHVLAGLGGDDAGLAAVSGCGVAGVVKEAGERVDGFEEQRAGLGLLVGGVLGAEARDEMVPPCGCLLFVLGGLVPCLVSGSPPAECFGAGDRLAGGLAPVSPG
ncbi:MAG TPA: hypothetical protein VG253_06150 [Streptosporangiaceae bacterium]|nr:hypothetical protein [Streptosporangiaceae bacterium]